jgi:hypothetical protein
MPRGKGQRTAWQFASIPQNQTDGGSGYTVDVFGRGSGASEVFIAEAPYVIASILLVLSTVGVRLLLGTAGRR